MQEDFFRMHRTIYQISCCSCYQKKTKIESKKNVSNCKPSLFVKDDDNMLFLFFCLAMNAKGIAGFDRF